MELAQSVLVEVHMRMNKRKNSVDPESYSIKAAHADGLRAVAEERCMPPWCRAKALYAMAWRAGFREGVKRRAGEKMKGIEGVCS